MTTTELFTPASRWQAKGYENGDVCEICPAVSGLRTDPHCSDILICSTCLSCGLLTYSIEDLGSG